MARGQEEAHNARLGHAVAILAYGVLAMAALAGGAMAGFLFTQARSDVTLAGAPGASPPAVAEGIERLVRLEEPRPVADLVFVDSEGKTRHLSEWRGKTVLLNLWASWCAPCKLELPALDRLQAKLGGDKFMVLALSTDRAGLKAPQEFYAKAGISHLGLFVDSTAAATGEVKAEGLPLSIVLNAQGQEVARLLGPADWDSPKAQAAIESFLAK